MGKSFMGHGFPEALYALKGRDSTAKESETDQNSTAWWFGNNLNLIFCYFPRNIGLLIIPNWRTHIFQRGGPSTNQLKMMIQIWQVSKYGVSSSSWGYPFIAGWFTRDFILLKWMMTGGTPILGNLHMFTQQKHVWTCHSIESNAEVSSGAWGVVTSGNLLHQPPSDN